MANEGLYGSRTGENLVAALVTEFLGTYFLVLAGIAVVVAAALKQPIAGVAVGSAAVAWTFGLVLAALVFALGHISGAHLNPAVTAGLAAARKFPLRYVLPYWLAQLGGAIFAAETVLWWFGLKAKTLAHLGATYPARGIDPWKAFGAEGLMTFLLVLVIMAVATDDRVPVSAAGVAIGAALAVGVIVAGPLTGGAINPARALGPMLVNGDLHAWWSYVGGECIGGMLAGWLYAHLLAKGEDPSETE